MHCYHGDGTPILVSVGWVGKNGTHESHKLVVDTTELPERSDGNWYKIKLYDPNHPWFSDYGDLDLMSPYHTAEDRCVNINPETEEWYMETGLTSNSQPTLISEKDKDTGLAFYRAEFIPEDHLFGIGNGYAHRGASLLGQVLVRYYSKYVRITDPSGKLMYRTGKGYPDFVAEGVSVVPASGAVAYAEDSDYRSNQILLPEGTYEIEMEDGSCSVWNDDDYCGVLADGALDFKVDSSTSFTCSAASDTPVNIVVEDVEGDAFTCVSTDLIATPEPMEVSLQGSSLSIRGADDQVADIKTTSEGGKVKTREGVKLSEVKDLDVSAVDVAATDEAAGNTTDDSETAGNTEVTDKAEKTTKSPNKMSITKTAKTVKYKALKKKAVVVKPLTVKKANGEVTYKLMSATKGKKKVTKQFKVAAKTGKVTVKRKTPKGTYKVKVRVTAKGDANHDKLAKSVVARILVK